MTNKARTIEIFLPNGDPKGIKTAGITSRTIEATYIPRSKSNDGKIKEDLGAPAVYVLATFFQDQSKPEVYIGETENFSQRLGVHNARVDFWEYAIAFTSKTRFFTKTHVNLV